MTKKTKKHKKSDAKIMKKPIHDQRTRKVSALPELIKQSERPDGEAAETVEKSDDPRTVELAADPSLPDGGLFDDLFSEPEDG